jgi:hypothetical protein
MASTEFMHIAFPGGDDSSGMSENLCRMQVRRQVTDAHEVSCTTHIHILSARLFMCINTYIHMRELMHIHVSCVSVFVGIFRENAWIQNRAHPFPCAHAKSCLFRISLFIYLPLFSLSFNTICDFVSRIR